MNRVILMGRLTADPELRQTPSGISVATFTVAVDRRYQAKGQERESDFIPCVAWRQTGEFISQYFQKGRMIAVEGNLQTRKYEDKNGNKRTAYEVIVDQAYFADSKPSQSASPIDLSEVEDGDLPW
ncbi:MAG: single-stranded DNA-binding protein [Lentisphaeria bacterium]|nr:single-stranded DNA-binding protein [Lentisphaeria bacterium]